VGNGPFEWVGPRAGLLLHGVTKPEVVSKKILFGNDTFGMEWDHGYQPLGLLDRDHNGKLEGDEMAELWIWLDSDSNAKISPEEVLPASHYFPYLPISFKTEPGGDVWQDAVPLHDGTLVNSWDWWSKSLATFPMVRTLPSGSVLYEYFLPLPSLPEPELSPVALYRWDLIGSPGIGGTLMFVRCGKDLYLFSVSDAALSLWPIRIPYTKVAEVPDGFAWTFRGIWGETQDLNSAQVLLDGMLLGKALQESVIPTAQGTTMEPIDYEWEAYLITDSSFSTAPSSVRYPALFLMHLSRADFCASMARGWPESGHVEVHEYGKFFPSVLPPLLSLPDLFPSSVGEAH
jgi:hypothetical protein